MAPCWVHTYAETSTASLCASSVEAPRRREAANVAVNESPAPTVSATLTWGVWMKETLPGVNT